MKMAKPSPGHALPIAPKYHQLPTAKPRAARGAPETVEIGVGLEIVTPILGGSYQTRRIDDVDVIRAPSVRGHLRFWWRALYAAQYGSAKELYQRESALWGRAATEDGGRSAVEIRVSVERAGSTDSSEIRLFSNRDQPATPGAYALWPARAETKTKTPTAPRRQPGTQFQLTLKVPVAHEAEVKNALRAWILFGGYGGRTRRGLGSLKVIGDINGWLPTAATRDALTSLFGTDVFAAPRERPAMCRGSEGPPFMWARARTPATAQTAWTTALDWLKDFRQGTTVHQGGRAREPGTASAAHRPSISNWPEGDKVRRLSDYSGGSVGRTRRGTTRRLRGLAPVSGCRSSDSSSSRAARNDRTGGPEIETRRISAGTNFHRTTPTMAPEPQSFELRWRAGNVEHDRLASPLIVKALPLVDGWFAPCALWLNRAYPANGEVVLRDRLNSQAPFDRLVAAGDRAQFSALANRTSLREAFLDWLHATKQTTVVAP
jgi:CRISPR-associated protein Cmr1